MELEEFIRGWRCRICKIPLDLSNFGGIGPNHFIGCKDCREKHPENFGELFFRVNSLPPNDPPTPYIGFTEG